MSLPARIARPTVARMGSKREDDDKHRINPSGRLVMTAKARNEPHRDGGSKSCERCGQSFIRRRWHVPAIWKVQKYCSRECGRPIREAMTVERFEGFFIKSAISGCWNWTGYSAVHPRSLIRKGFVWMDGKNRIASRVSWEIYKGPIPAGMKVCHTCDNPMCVNPDHFFLGTQADNIADMDAKGRRGSARGSLHGASVLTESQVRVIRRDTRPYQEIAEDFEIARSTVSAIKNRQNWGWLE